MPYQTQVHHWSYILVTTKLSNNDENPGTLRPYFDLLFLIWYVSITIYFWYALPHCLCQCFFFNHKTLGCGNNHIGYKIKPWTPRIKLSLLYSLMFYMKHIFRFYVLDTWSSLLISSNSPLWILPLMNRWHWGQVLDFMHIYIIDDSYIFLFFIFYIDSFQLPNMIDTYGYKPESGLGRLM